MRALGTLRARGRATAGVVSAAVLVGAVATVAVTYDGIPTEEVELHDAGVWVTNRSEALIGRVNQLSSVIDGVVGQTGGAFDVLQDGATVLSVDLGALGVLDGATLAPVAQVALPASSAVSLAGGQVAISDAESGEVWALPVTQVAAFDVSSAPAIDTFGPHTVQALSGSGALYVASPSAGVVRVSVPDENGVRSVSQLVSAEDADFGDSLVITVVGERPVVLDVENGRVVLPGGKAVDLDDADTAVLQAVSADADAVVLADARGLVSQPLDGSEAARTAIPSGADGVAAQPVVVGSCVYAAWGGVDLYLRDCADDASDSGFLDIPEAQAGATYVFRVNRGYVRLNDTANGLSWAGDDSLAVANNWDDFDDAVSPDQQQPEDQTEPTLIEDRPEVNTPPEATDDEFGARAGRTTILPIVDNDFDIDGDVLSATVTDATGLRGAQLQVIRDGGAVQISVPDDVAGALTFGYRVDDGRGGSDDAVVTVTVADPSVNTAPVQRATITPSFTVEADGVMTYNVLPHWIDPEGDPIYLVSATVDGGDQVEFTGDGELTYHAASGVLGVRHITVVISDGVETAEGDVIVTVVESGTGRVVTNPDYVSTEVGLPVVVHPLTNDYSPSGAELRLTSAEAETAGADVSKALDAGTVTVRADRAGTYYVLYAATLGDRTSQGIIRVDVRDAVDVTEPPIAVQDSALIPPGESVLVDVLANDTDPAGGVLVVTSVDVPASAGIAVAVINHQILRVTNVAGITAPVTFSYNVSNGMVSSADVTVIPIEPSGLTRGPRAVDDDAVVRAGDVVTVDVVANDSHPDGLEIALAADALPNLEAESNPAKGEAFASDGEIRFVAAAQASGTQELTYQVADSRGQRATAILTIKIVASDAENTAPRPQEVTARVIAGSIVRIPVPLNGVDPDSDSVTLAGADVAPSLGRVVEVGEDWLSYEAYPGSIGMDTFTYVVRDTFGAEGMASVRVGIAAPESTNLPPVPVADDVTMRPGSQMAVSVLANDSDPEGQELALVGDSLVVSEGVQATIAGSRVVVTAGRDTGNETVQYVVRDSLGSVAYGVVRITIDENAPLVAPVARDDRVTGEQISASGDTVDVSVLDNDDDPDGVVSALRVTADSLAATVNADGTVTVAPDADPQLIRYTITDGDGLSDSAFIIVPGAGDGRPALRAGAAIEVVSGETKQVSLGDLVITADGGPAIVTTADSVRASHSDGTGLVVDATTLTYTSAPGYYGPDAISFEVTDGATVDDPAGKVSRLSVPITVLPAENVAPTLVGATLSVADSEPGASLDLSLLASDPNPDDTLTFALGGDVPSGLDATVEDSTLTVALTSKLAKGTSLELPVTVTDGLSDPVAATIVVTVVASGRPMPAAVDDYVDDATAGRELVVEPLVGDFNPFSDSGPLKLVSASLESGSAAVSTDGDAVRVTPSADFYGTVVIKYTMVDVTGDPDRFAEGRIYVTVADAPDAPTRPRVVSEGNQEVTLEWDAPDSRGATITEYTVTGSHGQSETTTATTLTFTKGLVNGDEYTFTVTATNSKGTSDASPSSDPAHPNAVPDQPAAPELAFGDKSLDVSWTAPTNVGSAITGYTLTVSPAMPNGQSSVVVGAQTSTTISGLENGVAYQVAVLATNAGGDSEVSSYSATEIPAGPPFAAGKPTTSMLAPVGDRAQMQIAWTPADGNGDEISTYDVLVYRGGSLVKTISVPGGSLDAAIELDTSETDYTFAVVGNNKSPQAGDESEQSDARRAVVAPGAPTGVVASTPQPDGRIVLAFTPGPRNGATAGEVSYQYQLDGNGSWLPLSGNAIPGLSVSKSYQVQVRAVSTVQGATYTGAASASSNAARPYLPIGAAGIGAASGSGQVTFTVTAPATNGRSIASIAVCTVAGGGTCTPSVVSGFTSGSRTFTQGGLSAGGQARVFVVVTVATNPGEQANSSSTNGSGTAKSPSGTTDKTGNAVGEQGCTTAGCAYYLLHYTDVPSGTYTVRFYRGSALTYTVENVPLNGNGSYAFDGSTAPFHRIYFGYNEPTSIEVVGLFKTPDFNW